VYHFQGWYTGLQMEPRRISWSGSYILCSADMVAGYSQIDSQIDEKIDGKIDGKTNRIPNLITDMPFYFQLDHQHMVSSPELYHQIRTVNGLPSLFPKGKRERRLQLEMEDNGRLLNYSSRGSGWIQAAVT
jgi:hypothetical protein